MGLRKSVLTQAQEVSVLSAQDALALLYNEDRELRRKGAREAALYPELVGDLARLAQSETCFEVREAIFFSLQQVSNAEVVNALIPLLSSEDVWCRNAAIEVLQSIPQEIEKHIIALLNDRDSDVRIFAIDILQVLAHPSAPSWLVSVLKDEEHVNVVAAAIDRLAEIGRPDMLAAIKEVAMRFRSQPYIQFACSTAIERIEAVAK